MCRAPRSLGGSGQCDCARVGAGCEVRGGANYDSVYRIVRGSSGSDDDCDPSGYVAVSGRGCESYIHMDGGYYGGSTYLSGGSTSLEDCAAAVRAYDGQDGCRGAYFFYESDGYCNCPRDDCELGSENQNAGGPGRLYRAGCSSGGGDDNTDHDNNVCYFRGFGWRGWCEGGPNTEPPGEHALALDECWEKCASVYVDLVSVDYWPNGIEAYPGVGPCWCQTSCTHITFDHVTESQYPELAIVSGTIPADSGLVCSEPSGDLFTGRLLDVVRRRNLLRGARRVPRDDSLPSRERGSLQRVHRRWYAKLLARPRGVR